MEKEPKKISSNISIDLNSKPQIDAYYNLLLAIGGHAQSEEPTILTHVTQTIDLNTLKDQINRAAELKSEELAQAEQPAKDSRSRSKKVEKPSEETAPSEDTATAEDVRKLAAQVSMIPGDGMQRRNAFKVWATENLGTFKADEMTPEQCKQACDNLRTRLN